MRALGLIEVIGLVGAIEAADAALKAANVTLIQTTKVGSGIMTVEITGDVGAVKAAVEAGAEAASRITTLRAKHVIPRIDESLLSTVIPPNKFNKNSGSNSSSEIKDSEIKNSEIKDTEIKDSEIKDTEITVDDRGKDELEVTGNKDIGKSDLEVTVNADIGKSELEINGKEERIGITTPKMGEVDGTNQGKDSSVNTSKIGEFEEDLLKKSNSELRNMITELGITMAQDDIKRLKKQELVAILEKHLMERREKGDS